MPSTNSRARVAMIVIALLLLFLWIKPLMWLIALLGWVIGLAAVYEIQRMGRHKGMQPSLLLGFAGVTAFMGAGMFPAGVFISSVTCIVLLLVICAFAVQLVTQGVDDSLRGVPLGVFGPVYVGVPLAAGMQVLWLDRMLFLFVLLLVWTVDTAAYYVGRKYGKHPLAPVVSPKKTREGSLGGVIGCLVLAVLWKALVPEAAFDLSWGETFVVALLVAGFAQLGDLAVSMLKRDAGVKDSGVPLTGHGGVLDRVDSLLFAFAIFYVFLLISDRVQPYVVDMVQL
jgi:phosphatidate cytidylyltransferase